MLGEDVVVVILRIFLFIGVCFFGAYKAESEAEVLEKVEAGISAGEAITELLDFESTSKILTRITGIAKAVGPFLGALGPVVSLITMFLPQGESEELQEMKKRFAVVDANFDKVFNRVSEIKNLIDETSLKNQYSPYESKVVSLSRRLQHFLNAPTSSANEFKSTFMESYKSSYDNSAFVIWRGMIGKGITFQYDIALQAIKYTNNHRRRVQKVMNGGLNLILQGVKIHLTYLKLAGRNDSYETEKKEWEGKIKDVLERMKDIDRKIESNWKSQASTDALNQMAEYKDKSNAALADKVYSILTDKFDWRIWLVVVYDPLHGSDEHWVQFCGGFHKFRHHGKNMVVASDSETSLPLDRSCAETELLKTKTKPTTTYERFFQGHPGKIDAVNVVKYHFPPEYKGCVASPGLGAILKRGDPEFRGPSNRFVVKDNNDYKLYVFQ